MYKHINNSYAYVCVIKLSMRNENCSKKHNIRITGRSRAFEISFIQKRYLTTMFTTYIAKSFDNRHTTPPTPTVYTHTYFSVLLLNIRIHTSNKVQYFTQHHQSFSCS